MPPSSHSAPDRGKSEAPCDLEDLRDALEDAIRHAFCGGPRGEGWYVTGEPTGADPAVILNDPNKMRFLHRIQEAAWNVVKERVE